jgi:hypothetical protein
MRPVKMVGNLGMVMLQTCVDIIYLLLVMLIFKGFNVGCLLTISMPSLIKMEVAHVSAIAWVNAIVVCT